MSKLKTNWGGDNAKHNVVNNILGLGILRVLQLELLPEF